ncbi:tubulin monoglutamylase TTLL4-like [Osmia bicornis bicornis]|uniref:tubulin monoglutamylase TTLL4-like n=1 Tax=Osmia bicornis bicornis TaxID=1437191 RepID=UPI001EAF77EC|nr:tubulin monoglutamylase TTLL4-like [Osmia bicornis bicornis]
MTNLRLTSNNPKPSPKSSMYFPTKQDASTGTCSSKLSSYDQPENDELEEYIEFMEHLMTIRAKPCESIKPRIIIDPPDDGDKKMKQPMRKSLFAHVPPFIIFKNQKNSSKLPAEITRHLLWWRPGNYTPRIIVSTVLKSGFRTSNKSTSNWCGTWCNNHAYSKLKSTNLFSKVSCFPSCIQLGDKISLWTNFRKMRRKFGSKNFDYIPLTFVLPEERNGLRKFMRRNDGVWIVKPPGACAGHGIKVVTRLQEIPDRRSLVAQRYITRPHLLDGIKFDIRLYVLLTSIDPLRIYLYKEGLVRLATVKYIHDVRHLTNRFMHLTNTSVNKFSPNFQPNDSPDECKGNMWSLKSLWNYLSTMEGVNILELWNKIKDLTIKTMISAEAALVNASKKTTLSSYNFYQLFGFDVLLDGQYRPWLLEVNDYPSMEPDTPLCKLVKGQLAKDYLNLVGFHVPDLLNGKELKILRMICKQNGVCYDRQLYSNLVSWKDRRKQYIHEKMNNRKTYLKTILKRLTPDDVRVLIRHEDEISQTGDFEKIFPTSETYRYLGFFEKVRYYNLLLDAWEKEYGQNRSVGIQKLRKLCRRKYHLS